MIALQNCISQGFFWPLFGHRRRLDLPKYWIFGKIWAWVSIKFLSFGLSFQKLLDFLSKSFKITLSISLTLCTSNFITGNFFLKTCRFVEFSNEKSLSFGAKILEFEFLGRRPQKTLQYCMASQQTLFFGYFNPSL